MDRADWTVVLSGPLAQRAVVLSSLDRAGAAIEPSAGTRGHSYGLSDTDPSVGWVAARHEDLNAVVDIASRPGWTLRLHWPTPACRACNGTGFVNHSTAGQGPCLHCEGKGRTNKRMPSVEEQMAATIAALEGRIAVLEGTK